MARPETYRIADEPLPSAHERLAVDPVWPFFASMFAGAWLAWPWFVVNSVALGSPTRNGDVALVLGGLLATAGSVLGVGALASSGVMPASAMAYALLLPLGIRITLAYVLYTRQARTFELFKYFGGASKNGLPVIFAGAVLRAFVLGKTVTFWTLVFG